MDDCLTHGQVSSEEEVKVTRKRRHSFDPLNKPNSTADVCNLQDCKGIVNFGKTRKKGEIQDDNFVIQSTMLTSDCLNMKWKVIQAENLDLQYAMVFSKARADVIFEKLERETEYFSRDLARVFVFGKWHDMKRKIVAYGDKGLTYTFSGTTIPALPWTHLLQGLRLTINTLTGYNFNFVLINRYNNGEDHIGEHRDDEKDLCKFAPIASLSFGQHRDFVLRHCDSRRKESTRHIPPLTLTLEHGSLLLMNYPTNCYWYHSLPVRKRALHPRINLTFRVMVEQVKNCDKQPQVR